MNALLWSLMCASATGAVIALSALGKRRLIHVYPALSAMLLGSFGISTVLLWTKFSGQGFEVYAARWTLAQPIIAALHLAVTIEAFVHVCLNFTAIRRFGAVLGFIFAGLSVAVTYLIAGVGNPNWQHLMAKLSRLLRNESLACLLFLVLTVIFFAQFPFQDISRNLRRHLIILGSLFLCLFAANLIVEAGSGDYVYTAVYQILINAGPGACYLAWAVGMTADGETWGRLGFPTAAHTPPT